MEYIQTTLFRILAERIPDLVRDGGLIHGLEGHKLYLQQVDGFAGMEVTRTLNTDGEVQVMVTTRWQDAGYLAAYEEGAETVQTVIEERGAPIVVPNTHVVVDMEVLV